MNISWEDVQRKVRAGGLALGFVGVGAALDGVYNGTAKLPWLHQQAAELRVAKAVEIPKLKAVAHCEHVRADVSEDMLKEAAAGDKPDPDNIPADCPHPK